METRHIMQIYVVVAYIYIHMYYTPQYPLVILHKYLVMLIIGSERGFKKHY
jgi:hypothetical protein